MKRSNSSDISKTAVAFDLDQTPSNIASQMLDDPIKVAKRVQHFPNICFEDVG